MAIDDLKFPHVYIADGPFGIAEYHEEPLPGDEKPVKPSVSARSGIKGIERHAVCLRPFDFDTIGEVDASHPLKPIVQTGGLVFPITPTISESLNMNYEAFDISQSNESYNVYKGTGNRQISLSNIVFPTDTFEGGRYALAVVHFLRTYSLSDFGVGRTGRPPSPMWLSGFGPFMYNKVPCVMTTASFNSGGQEMDLIPTPSPGKTTNSSFMKRTSRSGSLIGEVGAEVQALSGNDWGDMNWLPAKFEIGGISLIVQHSPLFWKTFNLDDYRNGKLVEEQW